MNIEMNLENQPHAGTLLALGNAVGSVDGFEKSTLLSLIKMIFSKYTFNNSVIDFYTLHTLGAQLSRSACGKQCDSLSSLFSVSHDKRKN